MHAFDFKTKKTIFSLEVFPPKKTSAVDTIISAIDNIQTLRPDFISVTYGAGGGGDANFTEAIALKILRDGYCDTVAHLSCINNSKEEIEKILTRFQILGIKNILALRGDVNPNIARKTDFTYASDLVKFIKQHGDFHVLGACYPEGHIESDSLVKDIINLKQKVDVGVEHLISQLFFDNSKFYDFREKMAIAGINVKLEAGIMPIVNKKQIERMVSMCGASLPTKFVKVMQRFENNEIALRDAGIAYATDQIVDLISNGVDGIHLYTMNNAYVAKAIYSSIKSMI